MGVESRSEAPGETTFATRDILPDAFDLAPIGMTLAGRDGRWLRVNEAFGRMLGYTPADLIELGYEVVTHPEDREETRAQLERFWSEPVAAVRWEKRYVHRDGHTVWALVTISILRGEAGIAIAHIQDITERKVAEEALRRRDAILAAVASTASSLLAAADWRDVIASVLERLGASSGASRACIFQSEPGADGIAVTTRPYAWCAPGVPDDWVVEPRPGTAVGLDSWAADLEAGRHCQAHARDLPDAERAYLEARQIRSALAVPIHVDGRWWGSIGFDECLEERVWSAAEVGALRVAAGAVGAAIARQAAEQSRREAEDRYRTLIEHLPLTFYIDNTDASISAVYMSPQIEEVLGYPVSDWLADPDFFGKVVHPDDRERQLSTPWPAGGVHDDEYRLVARDGRTVWFHDRYVIVTADDGKPQYAQGYMLDVTERKRVEEALRATNETLQALIDASPLSIVAVDRDERVTLWSRGAERIFGWTAAETLGGPLPFAREELAEEDERLRASAARSQKTGGVESRRSRKDGTPVDLSSYSAPLRDANGNAVGMLVISADVTERKALEAQLLHSQRMEAVGRLAGGIAHDFNNLLTAIRGYADFLREGLGEGTPLRRDAEEISRAGERASALVRQLLAFSRGQVLRPEVVDVGEIVRQIETMLRRLIGEDVELVIDLDGALASVSADAGQLEQTVINLAVNAREAMPDGGTLTIRTRNVFLDVADARRLDLRPGTYVRLSAEDTGVGMDERTRLRAFEPFFTTKPQGTGLGLSTVYGIVTQSGGNVEADSRPGEGSVLSVYLPAVSAQVREPAAGPPSAGIERGSETVLLVEDEDVVRNLARRVLHDSGYRVIEAGSGEEALRLAGEHADRIDLLLTDVVMPGMNGRELADRLAEIRPGTRVVFMSGYTEDVIVKRGVSGRRAFLAKPFTPPMLARSVREALDAPARAAS
jgi:PAS domain S-box-containing protein